MKDIFELAFNVRDYECDQTGVVNNAVYQNYLEHARHEYLKKFNVNFSELAKKKVALVIVKAVLTYRSPLRSGDEFVVCTRMERKTPSKFQFLQDIYSGPDRTLVLRAEIVGTALSEHGPLSAETLVEMFPELKFFNDTDM